MKMAHPRGPKKNIVGQKFGRWTVISFAGYGERPEISKNSMWLCNCDCGTEREVLGRSLVYGYTESCGCLSSEITADRNKTHGMSHTREYNIWCLMRRRVNGNGNEKDLARYKDRGITCCVRWGSFESFYEDMGPCPPGHSIDRKNNDLGYSPDNCRWATSKTQARNRVTSLVVNAFGESLTLAEWADRTTIPYPSLWARIFVLHWSPEKALSISVRAKQETGCQSI